MASTTAERVTIKLDRTFPWEVDGGDQDRTKKFKVQVVPGAVRICQPRNVPAR
jgi:diacylglycerol kinase family enzyme